MVRALPPAIAQPDWKLPTDLEMVPLQGEEWFLSPFVLTRWGIVQPVLTKAVLQLAKAVAMFTVCHEYALSQSHFFLASGKLIFQKKTVPTDNMRPKSAKTKTAIKAAILWYPRADWWQIWLHQAKTYHTDLAVTNLCMAIQNQQICQTES